MSQVVLSLHDVVIRYGDFVAVHSLCLQVIAGEIFGLLGPNGSGKSSTLSAIVGGIPITSGRIRLQEHCPQRHPEKAKRLVGLTPQEIALYDDLTIEQNLLFFGRVYGLHGRTLKNRLDEVLQFVQLAGFQRRIVRSLSGGMQRRVNLACSLLHRPQLLLLDEPTVGLDIQSRDAIFASLRTLRDQGCAIVFTTHHLEEAELLCDRIAIMDRGRLIAVGNLNELCTQLPPVSANQRHDGPHRLQGAHTPSRSRLEQVYLELTGPRIAAAPNPGS